jgi:hypothetical protein
MRPGALITAGVAAILGALWAAVPCSRWSHRASAEKDQR